MFFLGSVIVARTWFLSRQISDFRASANAAQAERSRFGSQSSRAQKNKNEKERKEQNRNLHLMKEARNVPALPVLKPAEWAGQRRRLSSNVEHSFICNLFIFFSSICLIFLSSLKQTKEREREKKDLREYNISPLKMHRALSADILHLGIQPVMKGRPRKERERNNK